MKKFIAHTEERYVWTCPYCGEMCEDECEDPAAIGVVECEHCGRDCECEYTER